MGSGIPQRQPNNNNNLSPVPAPPRSRAVRVKVCRRGEVPNTLNEARYGLDWSAIIGKHGFKLCCVCDMMTSRQFWPWVENLALQVLSG